MTLSLAASIVPCPIGLVRRSDVSHPERGVAAGQLVRVRAGVFADAQMWQTLAPWERFLARVHAVASVAPDAVFCLEAACALLGLPIFGDPVVVHVLATGTGTARLRGGIRLHTGTHDRDLVEHGGLLMTSLAETAVDIARTRHNAVGLAVADAALRLDPTLTADDLAARNEARASSRGRAIARWPLARATGVPESVLESVSLATIEWLGFPAPDLQVTFTTGTFRDRLDFGWHRHRAGLEADGDIKYDGRFGTAAEVLHRQRVRDARLRQHLNALSHVGWYEVTTVDPLRSTLRGMRLVATDPEHSAQLFSLRRALSPLPPHRAGDAETASGGRTRG